MTNRQLTAAVNGYQKRQIEEWERTRFLATQIVNMSGKQAKREIKPWEIMRLPGDKVSQRRVAKFTKNSREEVKKKWAKLGRHLEEWELDKMFNDRVQRQRHK